MGERLAGASAAIGYVSRGQGAGPLIVTERAGLFERAGVPVVTRSVSGSSKIPSLLASGELAFGNLAASRAILEQKAAGADLVFVTGGINQQFLVGRPGLSEIGGLAGGTVATSADGQLTDLLSSVVVGHLRGLGLVAPERVTYEGQAARMDALLSGAVDAVVLSPPGAIEARAAGASFLLDFAELGLNYALGGLLTRRTTIEDDPELVARVVEAYVCGMHRYKSDREFAIVVQADYSGTGLAIARQTYEITEPGMPHAPYPVPAALDRVIEYCAADGAPEAGLRGVDLVDARFVGQLDSSGFIDRLYA